MEATNSDIIQSDEDDDYFSNPLKHIRHQRIIISEESELLDVDSLESKKSSQGIAGISYENTLNVSDSSEDVPDDLDSDSDDGIMRKIQEESRKRRNHRKEDLERKLQEAEQILHANFTCASSSNKEANSVIRPCRTFRGQTVSDVKKQNCGSPLYESCNDLKSLDSSIELVEDEVIEKYCTVSVKDMDTDSNSIYRCKMSSTLRDLSAIVGRVWSCDPNNISFYRLNNEDLPTDETLEDLQFSIDDVNYIISQKKESQLPDLVEIKWLLKDKKPILGKIIKSSKFSAIKSQFCEENGFSINEVHFTIDGDEISDEETPALLGIEDGDCIDVCT
ncbi:hypothetical protein AB6A40_004717 [Gnathostoma spinigerum]|uniref:Rad60/SUMO-like domain-containing protein n=1 Tax=Gnathostoma spinigerum TaxID=75299 RepID=A0ABD6EDB1_9BILA